MICRRILRHTSRSQRQIIICLDQMYTWKRIPHAANLRARVTNLNPRDVICIDDLPGNVQIAKELTMTAVAVLSGFDRHENLVKIADFEIPDVTYLPNVLQRLGFPKMKDSSLFYSDT